MAENGNQVALPSKTVNQLVPSLTVVLREDLKVEVPLTANDNLLLSQVRVAQLRQMMDKQLQLLKTSSKVLPPLAVKALVDSYAKVEDMARFAYAPGLNESEGGAAAGKAAAEVARAIAEGVATAGHKAVANAKEDRMKMMLELGKPKKVTPIEIVEEKPKEENWE